MKIAAAAVTLSRYADTLEVSNGSAVAGCVRAFVKALESVGTLPVNRFAHSCAGLSFPASGNPPHLGELKSPLESLLQLLADIAKPEFLADLNHILAVIREHGDTPISEFASVVRRNVASASKGQSKRGAAPMDQSLVDDYLKKLELALGDDVAFRALFREIDADKRVTKLEAIELATRFMGPTPPSTSRPKALQRVLHRHQKLVEFKRSSELIRRGRSAA